MYGHLASIPGLPVRLSGTLHILSRICIPDISCDPSVQSPTFADLIALAALHFHYRHLTMMPGWQAPPRATQKIRHIL